MMNANRIQGLFILLLISPLLGHAEPAKISDQDIMELIETRSAGQMAHVESSLMTAVAAPEISRCGTKWFANRWKEVNGYLGQGNSAMANATAQNEASTAAACSLIKYKQPEKAGSKTIPDLGLDGWSAIIGRFLAASVASGEADRITADHALKFLTYAKAHGKSVDDLISIVKKSLGTNEPSKDAPALSGTAVSIVSKYAGNTFSFEQQYLGKVIQATGKVTHINGSGDSASITLLGNTTKSKNDLGFQDSIACSITNPEFLSRVGKLRTGGTATVRGVYSKGLLGQIELKNCEIK